MFLVSCFAENGHCPWELLLWFRCLHRHGIHTKLVREAADVTAVNRCGYRSDARSGSYDPKEAASASCSYAERTVDIDQVDDPWAVQGQAKAGGLEEDASSAMYENRNM